MRICVDSTRMNEQRSSEIRRVKDFLYTSGDFEQLSLTLTRHIRHGLGNNGNNVKKNHSQIASFATNSLSLPFTLFAHTQFTEPIFQQLNELNKCRRRRFLPVPRSFSFTCHIHLKHASWCINVEAIMQYDFRTLVRELVYRKWVWKIRIVKVTILKTCFEAELWTKKSRV